MDITVFKTLSTSLIHSYVEKIPGTVYVKMI